MANTLYLLAVTTIGIYIAVVRGASQIGRAFGDLLGVWPAPQKMRDIFSGTLHHFLFIFWDKGNLDFLRLIYGFFGTCAALGILAFIALMTLPIEIGMMLTPTANRASRIATQAGFPYVSGLGEASS